MLIFFVDNVGETCRAEMVLISKSFTSRVFLYTLALHASAFVLVLVDYIILSRRRDIRPIIHSSYSMHIRRVQIAIYLAECVF